MENQCPPPCPQLSETKSSYFFKKPSEINIFHVSSSAMKHVDHSKYEKFKSLTQIQIASNCLLIVS